MIFSAFFKALGQLGDAAFRRVLVMGVGLTLGLFIVIYVAVFQLIGWFAGGTLTLPFIGEITWIGTLLSWGSVPLMILASSFLMVPVASAFTSLFLDQIADAVEARHYPELPPVKGVSLADGLRDSLAFLGILIVANLLALILYALFSALAPVIFWLLNGYLLGVEYFQLSAMRRVGRERARALRKRHLLTIWAGGTLMVVPLTLPIVNLLVPVLGAATFVHIFHALKKS